jgi:hypothetical protein
MAQRNEVSLLPVTYIIEHQQTSPVFGRAFAKGCGGKISSYPDLLLEGDFAGFVVPELQSILRKAISEGRNWYYGDKAYFGRGKYFRVTKNRVMHDCEGDATPHRFEKLGLKIEPRKDGRDIVIYPQSDTFFRLKGMNQMLWVQSVRQELEKYTDRPIRTHFKPTGNHEALFTKALHNAHAVVVHSSMAGVQASMQGVPCFATDPTSASAKFGLTDLSLIESPVLPDNRDKMAFILADNQFTLNELSSGMAWEKVK